MKTKALLAILLYCSCLSGQIRMGVPQGETYALIVGISKYSDPNIPSLKYSDRDAAAFAEYLRSAAGDFVPESNITLLTDTLATTGAIYNALYNIGNQLKKDDQFIFYFSGHGDVEIDTIYDLGYLLAWDTPSNCYRKNAISLLKINQEAARLSVNKEAKVVYILDACHSGELAGDANQGRILASNQMRKRKAKEVRIMSCEPEQKSLEVENLDGGRSIFSYHLIRGLTGLAEKIGRVNNLVTLRELEDYLEDVVANDAYVYGDGHAQNPLFDGEKDFALAKVDTMTLMALQMTDSPSSENLVMADSPATFREKSGRSLASDKSTNQIRDLVNAIKHSGITNHPDFLDKMNQDSKSFYQFVFQGLQDSVSRLSRIEKQALKYFSDQDKKFWNNQERRRQMDQNLAITLNDLAQQAINAYLQTNREELDKRLYTNVGESYIRYPLFMKKALDLLDKEHPLYASLELKYHYFNGVVKRLQILKLENASQFKPLLKEAMADQQRALALDNLAPYVHNEIGVLYKFMGQADKAEKSFKMAKRLAPTWAIPYSNISSLYNAKEDHTKAIEYADTSIFLKPDFSSPYLNLGISYQNLQNLIKAERNFRKAIDYNPNNYSPYEHLAKLYLASNTYELAEAYFIESDIRKGIYKEFLDDLAEEQERSVLDSPDLDLDGHFNTMTAEGVHCPPIVNSKLDKRIRLNPNDVEAYFEYAVLNEQGGCLGEAVGYYKKVVELDPEHLKAYLALGRIYIGFEEFGDAADMYYKVVELDRENFDILTKLGHILNFKLQRYEEAVPIYYRAIVLYPDHLYNNIALAELFTNQQDYEGAEIFYNKLEDLLPTERMLDFNMGYLYEQWQHFEEAESYYLSFIERVGDSGKIAKTKGVLFEMYLRLERYQEAEQLLLKIGSKEEIKTFYQDRVVQFPNKPHWLYQLALIDYKEEKKIFLYGNPMPSGLILLDEPIDLPSFLESTHVLPDSFGLSTVYFNNATEYLDIKQGAEHRNSPAGASGVTTIDKFKKLLLLAPDHEALTDIYIKTGDLYMWNDSFELSTDYYKKAIERDTFNANTHLKIVDSYLNVFYKEEALLHLEWLYENDMINFENRLKLGELMALAGRFDEAEQVLEKAKKIYPLELTDIYRKLGKLSKFKKEEKLAILYFKKVLELDANDENAAYDLLRIYAEKGDLNSAMSYLQKALESGFRYDHVLCYDPALNGLRLKKAPEFYSLLSQYHLENYNLR